MQGRNREWTYWHSRKRRRRDALPFAQQREAAYSTGSSAQGSVMTYGAGVGWWREAHEGVDISIADSRC